MFGYKFRSSLASAVVMV